MQVEVCMQVQVQDMMQVQDMVCFTRKGKIKYLHMVEMKPLVESRIFFFLFLVFVRSKALFSGS